MHFLLFDAKRSFARYVIKYAMRKELFSWFEQEGLLLQSISAAADSEEEDEVKVVVRAPMVALGKSDQDFRECPDPVLFGYPETCLDYMILADMHEFVLSWFEKAVDAGIARCFVCNKKLMIGGERPWDAIFITGDLYLWLAVHFDCKRALNREIKGYNPFEISTRPPELFDVLDQG
jgi:hypothetical protein